MRLVIAEKPSVMRELRSVMGDEGYIYGSAVGHLLRLKEPQEYGGHYKKWNLADLPIVPDFEFVPLEKTKDALDKLIEQMNSAEVDEIICATDAGREGECIFRYIYNYAGCKKPVLRLWISSLTTESIKNGFANLRPASDYDSVYEAGYARARLDWLWGMNLTRLYSISFGAISNIGRVKTAVVNMIMQRDTEIDSFKKKPFFKLKLSNGAEWYDEQGDFFTTRAEAENVASKCENSSCRVISAETKQKKENRPLLYSLTSLQADANEKHGFSAAKTLDIMQSLYEKKLLTYPRTDSNYLTDDMAAILPERLKQLRFYDDNAVDEILAAGLNIDNRVINNSKVSDHHAIIPTEYIDRADKTELSEDEKKILEMVIVRFFEVLSPQYEYTETEYIFECAGEKFKLRTKTPTKLGWRKFNTDEKSKSESVSCFNGDTFTAEALEITEGETTPPKHFTEAALLKAMENIDRCIEDKELAEYVTERGLGTPATRAAIIEQILSPQTALVERRGKSLVATEKGRSLINALPDEVKSIEMTAAMELQLSAIQKGTVTADEVVDSIVAKIRSIIELERGRKHISLAPPKPVVGKCPKCGGNIHKFVKDKMVMYYCENSPNSCFFRVFEDDFFFTSKGKKLTESVLKSLLTKGKVKLTGLKSEKTGKTYDALISFKDRVDKNGKHKVGFDMEFEKKGGR